MKLRIRADSLRLRLTRSEVETLHQDGVVEGRTGFGLREFIYCVVRDDLVDNVVARYVDDRMSVHLPIEQVDAWATGDDVGIHHRQKLDQSRMLEILIEKDFACLVPRENGDDSDTFPNPSARSNAKSAAEG